MIAYFVTGNKWVKSLYMPMYIGLTIFLLCQINMLSAQKNYEYYWITYADKANWEASDLKPWDLLSPRALERRFHQNAIIDEQDHPVSPTYLDQIKNLAQHYLGEGDQAYKLTQHSRWLNATLLAVETVDTVMLERMEALPFVTDLVYVGRAQPRPEPKPAFKTDWGDRSKYDTIPHPYGYLALANSIMNTMQLHDLGFRGKGKQVVVLDGGFKKVHELSAFDSLRQENRLLDGKDFIDEDQDVYESSTHGTKVMSMLASNIPYHLIGSGPDATYALGITENVKGEYWTEECFYALGLEWADSLGADVVTVSLGYTTFNNPEMHHTFETLDGRTAIGSIAGNIGAEKGLLLFNSAGNSGNDDWKYLGVPADAEGVIAVGAIDYQGKRTVFSSFGPGATGAVKPDIAVPGQSIPAVTLTSGKLGPASGTSFAAPLAAGAATSLYSAHPLKHKDEITQAIRESSNQYESPDEELGYGIPDFTEAHLRLYYPELIESEPIADFLYDVRDYEGNRFLIMIQPSEVALSAKVIPALAHQEQDHVWSKGSEASIRRISIPEGPGAIMLVVKDAAPVWMRY